uniref:Gag-Pol polyprotein n=1 Tax=Tanacetum cinerariifolium TaxID=118510 RepID=A0A699K9I1_TANCI|nr:hypothetical protein [Tanacetum cinerariifolium]
MVKYQKEVNDIRAESITKSANPLALVAPASPYTNPYYQAPKSHKSRATQPKTLLPTRSYATTKHKGKKIAKPITPPSEKPKRVKDSTYHKEKMLLYKQAEKGVSLQAEHAHWLEDTDEEIDEKELEAHYSFMEKIQETDQNAKDECAALANLIVNLKLDVDENKKIQKQLKKTNASLAH